ncbi:unnamed protein product [Allacma fusca]|uniref:Transposase n=1 Tax=Allacma fusca TaxID=39272 RepID=A0A8J2PWA1_9HEXA|nr:unnamed protein product [Allacma fusca]
MYEYIQAENLKHVQNINRTCSTILYVISYWNLETRRVNAITNVYGAPTFFLTLSDNSKNWPIVLQNIAQLLYGYQPLNNLVEMYDADLEKDGTLLNRKETPEEKKTHQKATKLLVHDPEKSTRRLAFAAGIAKTTVQRLIKDSGLRVTRPIRVQQLKPEDFPKRVQFSNERIAKFGTDVNSVNNIMWTDEASFDSSGTTSTRNAIWYGYSYPTR